MTTAAVKILPLIGSTSQQKQPVQPVNSQLWWHAAMPERHYNLNAIFPQAKSSAALLYMLLLTQSRWS
jgi:hypothetical protein